MHKSHKILISLFFCMFLLGTLQQNALSQVGGRAVYEFLDLSASARQTALGDRLISVVDDDVALAYNNPAVLSDSTHGQFTFNHRFFYSGIDHGYFSYGYHIPSLKLSTHAGIQYIAYGDFEAADIYGNRNGQFGAGELAVTVGASRNFGKKLSVGLNTKIIQSRLESYNSIGIATDLGLLYQLAEKQLNIGFVLRNMGTQLTSYANSRELLPFDVQIGISKKLEHLPFRFSMTAHHLHRWNILYDDPNEENTSIFIGEEQEENKISIFTDNLFRHLSFSGEFLLGKRETIRLRFGYDHLRRRELSVNSLISLAGFSFGAGLKIKRFTIDYGYTIYHLAGSTSHIGLSMNINKLVNRF